MVSLFSIIVDGRTIIGTVKCRNNVLFFSLKSFILYWKGKFAKILEYFFFLVSSNSKYPYSATEIIDLK